MRVWREHSTTWVFSTLRSGQTDDAVGWFRLAVDGGWRNSAFALGSLLEEEGDRKGAFAAFEIGAQQECALIAGRSRSIGA